uniref:4-coumarate--CoA ligase n=1 Tax=Timema genevievae TaxID=629358 RepID=A0A7R9PM35_TIMGE|nr:unnamed protein product [Timema genevievae]
MLSQLNPLRLGLTRKSHNWVKVCGTIGACKLWWSSPHQTFHFASNQIRHYSSVEALHVIKSPYPDIQIPDTNLVDFIWQNLDQWPDHTAVCGVTGREYTFAEIRLLSKRFASALLKSGYGRGDKLAIILPNTPEYPIIFLGAIEAGLIVCPINPIYSKDEMYKLLKLSGAKCIITVAANYTTVLQAISMLESLEKPFIIITQGTEVTTTIPEGAVNFQELIAKDIDTSVLSTVQPASPNDVVALPFSSGTTGLPKGVQLTHRNLVANILQVTLRPHLNYQEPTTKTSQDAFLCILPMFHIYGLSFIMLTRLFHGVKLVTLPKFEATTFLSSIKRHKVPTLFVVPPIILFLGSSAMVKSHHLDSVRYLGNAAAPIGAMDIEKLHRKSPHIHVFQGYGLTETSPCVILMPKELNNISSIGHLVPNTEAKVVDLVTDLTLPAGGVGELWIRGPQVMKGYLDNIEATNDVIDKDNWLRTGDLACYDDDNLFYIKDRLKELIKVKGYQVAPAELEEILRSHPSVAEAAVIGVPDKRAGEVPRAFVVCTTEVSEDELKNYVAGKVSDFKQLSEVKEWFGNQLNMCQDRGLSPGPPVQKSDTLPRVSSDLENREKSGNLLGQ